MPQRRLQPRDIAMVPLIKENASSKGIKSFPGRVVPSLTRPRNSESADLLRGSVSESNGCGSERISSSAMRCRMMRHVLLAMLLPCICHAQRIPVEIKSPMPLHEICTAPVQQDLPDHAFVGEGYTRIPYTAFSLDSMTQMMATDEALSRNQVHARLLHRIYQQKLSLSINQLSRSITSGDEVPIARLMTKLLAGHPVVVVALGGSITVGHGVESAHDIWVSRVFNWIQQTFPHEKHQFLNQAIPATPSCFMEPCISTQVPDNADLILLEYTVNDVADEVFRARLEAQRNLPTSCKNGFDHPARQSMERMLRKMLTLPSHPALLYVHAWAPSLSESQSYGGVEDYYTTMLAYYGITSLSLRNAISEQLRADPALRGSIWPGIDNMHPSCIGTKFMSDMVIGYLMDQAANLAWLQHAQHLQNAYPDPPQQLAYLGRTPLPEPLFKGNYGKFESKCVVGGTIASLVYHNNGFKWTNTGSPEKPKWAFIADQPNAEIVFKLGLQDVQYDNQELVVGFGLLLSWRKTQGVARSACIQGCSCQPEDHSTYIKDGLASMTYWAMKKVSVHHGSQECIMRITVAETTYSQGHQVSLNSLLVSGEVAFLKADIAYVETLRIQGPPTGSVHRRSRLMEMLGMEGGRTGGFLNH